ncbi:MAG: FUSC family protein, partial [Bacteroidales bacterium]|nr:FUSC family protein [Bacteroidales bacterium]
MQNVKNSFSAFITSFDPGYLALKRSIKTFIAILISLAIFWQNPGMAMFAAISSMLISRSQVGFTMAERRFTMLLTGITMILLSVPVSLASQNEWVTIAFIFLGAFATFFLIGSRVVPDFPAVSVLAVGVVEMAFSHTVESGIRYAGLFFATTTLVYILHFVIWPTRPRKRLKAQIEFIISNLVNYNNSIHASYYSDEAGMKNTQEMSDKVRRSIGDFRRLWQLFNVKAGNDRSIESRYLDIYTGLGKIHEYLLLMWQFRVSAWDSDLYKKLVIDNGSLNRIIGYLIQRHNPAIIKPSDIKLNKIKTEVDSIARDYLEKFKIEYTEDTHRSWVAVINAVKALGALVDDLGRLNLNNNIETPEFSIQKKVSIFFQLLKEASGKLKSSNPAFRLGIRSTIIIGSTATFVTLTKPDYGYWLILFAVLLIRPNLGVSIKAGRERFLGTLAGSLLALGFVMIIPSGHPVYYLLLLLSVFLMIWLINLNKIIPMVTSLTFMIVCLFYLLYPENTNLVWLRISYTFAIVLL